MPYHHAELSTFVPISEKFSPDIGTLDFENEKAKSIYLRFKKTV